MRNKTGHRLARIDRDNTHSLQKVYDPNPTSPARIFEVPAFMFSRREEGHELKKVGVETLNAFRPRLEMRQKRDANSGSKRRGKEGGNERVQQAKKRMEEQRSLEKRLNHIIEEELNHLREERRTYVSIDSDQLKRQIKAEQLSKSGEVELSPYAKYSTNSFPKKEQRALVAKQKSLNPGRQQLGVKLKCSIREKLEEMEARLQPAYANMLEVMTIYSIKEKPLPSPFFRKKQRYHPTLPSTEPPKDPNQLAQITQDSRDKAYHRKLHSYLSFLLKVAFSHNLPVRPPALSDRLPSTRLKVFVGHGNNRNLLVALLKRRFWLEITPRITTDTKFVWTQNSIREVHFSQKTYNQFLVWDADRNEKSKEEVMPVKPGLKIKINTMKKINPQSEEGDEEGKIGMRSLSLFQSSVGFQEPSVESEGTVLKMKKQRGEEVRRMNNRKLFLAVQKGDRADQLLQRFKISIRREIDPNWEQMQTITNHIPQNSFIGSKKALFYSMQHYYRNIKRIDPFTIIPRTYHFKSPDDQSYALFLQQEKQTDERSIWIVKPGECTNRGNGITILRASEVTRRLLKRQQHPNGQPKTTIVQSYITDPLLYHGRKFDLRHYIMVTVVRGALKAYWYAEGYARTSSEPFSLTDLANPYVHLTNDAIQQHSEKYGRHEPGNKLSYQELQRYLDATYPKLKINFKEDILSKMQEIATDIIRANYRCMDRERRVSNFEIFGLDFMLDRKMNPWLIEVNANPCLEISCPLLSRIIPLMVEQSLRLALDPLLPPPSHYPPNHRYYLPDNFLHSLKYTLIFDELEEATPNDAPLPPLYAFPIDQPEDEYENEGPQIDVGRLLD